MGAIAVSAYSYMALVPVIQPPIMKALTSKKERTVVMKQLRTVTKTERIIFPHHGHHHRLPHRAGCRRSGRYADGWAT
mgnify:FL=1